jgi:ribosome biogenesis GTPase
MMKLEDLGYSAEYKTFRPENNPDGFDIGRIVAEHKERYIVKTADGEYNAEITGNLRFSARSREDFPAVGDWVLLTNYDSDFAVIHKILPRYSVIKRQAVGTSGEIQIIATNVDNAFLVQAVDRDFNINRLERYLTICNSSRINPIIILTKIDLISNDRISEIIGSINKRIRNTIILAISNETHKGYDSLAAIIEKGKTYCMLGSSGAGKSTLLNNLAGKDLMLTGNISNSTGKGKHVTSHRELIILDDGGILIDNPGMREVGIADQADGLEITFDLITSLSTDCKFKDCTHTTEAGCAVIMAVEKEEIDRATYENYLRLEKEKAYFESTVAERRKKEKIFGKILKNYKKDMKKNMF